MAVGLIRERLLSAQIEQSNAVTEKRNIMNEKAKNIQKRLLDEADGDIDSKGNMPWSRKTSKKKKIAEDSLNENMTRLGKDLIAAREKHPNDKRYAYKIDVMSTMWKVVHSYAIRKEKDEFMTYLQFWRWFSGSRKKALEQGWVNVLDEFHREFGSEDNNEGSNRGNGESVRLEEGDGNENGAGNVCDGDGAANGIGCDDESEYMPMDSDKDDGFGESYSDSK